MPTDQQQNIKPEGKSADWWAKEIGKSVAAWDKFRERARKVIKRYRDEREHGDNVKRFNILYSNTETLRPAVYSKTPVPDIRRRFNDKDPVGRVAADVLQRSVSFAIDAYDCDGVLMSVNDDYTLPGFALARVKYIPHMMGEGNAAKLVYQEVQSEYVSWDKFAMSRAKNFNRVWWEAFAEDLSKEEVTAKFGQDIANTVEYDRGEGGDEVTTETQDDAKFCRVWEVWNKRDRTRFYIGNSKFLKGPEADPLKLENFWPNPEPLWAIRTTDTLIPIPEYIQYQDQALELDDLTQRIDVLTSGLRRRGVYNAENKDALARLVNADDNTFVPIDNWADLMAKGGLERILAELPIEGIAKIVLALYQARDQVKQTIYEVTGLADIIRGASVASETATAQQIKGQYAGMRLGKRKGALAKFARDLIRLKAELIAEKFRPEEFAEMTGLKLFQTVAQKQQALQAIAMSKQQQPGMPPAQPIPPEVEEMAEQPTWEEVIAILRSDKLRGFRIDIETDSTIQPDADQNKQRAVETVTAITTYFQQVAPAVQSGAMSIESAKDLLMVALRTFPNAEKFETVLDGMGEEKDEAKGPSPEMQAMQQQMAQQQQELAQREQQAKEQETSAQLAAKDAQIKQTQQQAILDKKALEIQHAGQILALKEEMFANQQAVAKQLAQIQKAAQAEVQAAAKQAQSIAERHVNAARGEVDAMKQAHEQANAPKVAKRVQIKDMPDGSTVMEEIIDQLNGEEPGGVEPAGETESTETD